MKQEPKKGHPTEWIISQIIPLKSFDARQNKLS